MNHERTHLDLFSGIGGFALAARNCGIRTVAFCEIEPFAQLVLKKNFGAIVADSDAGKSLHVGECKEAGILQSEGCNHVADTTRKQIERKGSGGFQPITSQCSPLIFPDIRQLDGKQFRGTWLLTGGFPCQPFSHAGKRRGAADDRHLWPEMLRVISEANPAWVIGENVAGFVSMELDHCVSDLENIGYACQPLVIPACATDARHRRDRVWIIGRSNLENSQCEDQRRRGISRRGKNKRADSARPSNQSFGTSKNATHALWSRPQGQRIITGGIGTKLNHIGDYCGWLPEPAVGRVAHGIPRRMDRLRGLGNAIVPQVAQEIIRAIIETEDEAHFNRLTIQL